MSDRPIDRRSFRGLMVAQFFGAFNDNCFKFFLLYGVQDEDSPLHRGLQSEAELSIQATILFTLPFILFSPHAGRLADRLSKRSVTVGVKVVEIGLMVAGAIGFLVGSFWFLVGVLFLMALQSTLFSPAKYGILPELLPSRELPRANGLLEMTTFLAIVLGTLVAGVTYQSLSGSLFIGGIVLAVLGFVGLVGSLAIRPVPPAVPGRRLEINPVPEIIDSCRTLYPDRTLRLTAAGITYFWSLASLLLLVATMYGDQVLGLDPSRKSLLVGAGAVGIGVGSWLAGLLSHEKPELGLVPLGSLGMGVFAFLLFFSGLGFWWALACMALVGLSGGFFIVPLNVLLQQEAPADQKGRCIAGVNLLANMGMLVGLGIVWLLMQPLGLGAAYVFLILGLVTIIATFFVFSVLPGAFFRLLFWVVTHVVYRITIVGRENLPPSGPALLVPNHVSYVDGHLILASTHRHIRFVVYKGFARKPGFRWLARTMRVIPISPDDGPREIVKSLREASKALENGELVCIFAEGEISRTGQLLPFRAGVEKILRGIDAPVIPVCLDGVWGSIFSHEGGRFFWKMPRQIPYPVTIHFGASLPATTPVGEIRQAVQELGSDAFVYRKAAQLPLPWTAVAQCRRRRFSTAAVDSSGVRVSRIGFLAGTIFLARKFAKEFSGEPMIGILVPPSVGSAIANVAASLVGKPVVNFNYTAGGAAMRSAAQQCGITRVLTSRKFLENYDTEVPGETVYLEDIREGATAVERLLAMAAAWTLPRSLLERLVGARRVGMDDIVTVIFSSGSTGEPKGVELTHFNVLSNTQAISQVFRFRADDMLLGVLPFFHSTGYTGGLWIPAVTSMGVVYHPNPLDARTVGLLAREHRATMMMATPTFLQNYTRRCQPGDFGSLRYVVVGAERLTAVIREAFTRKFGIEPLEAYGTTECSPLVTVNVDDFREAGIRQIGGKQGIGHPLPGVSVRIVDPETGGPRCAGEDGLLLVRGPNVMRGYLGKPEATAEVLRDGWYATGDIASLDNDGFLTLTDRLARFAKISGEMVPNLGVEQALHDLLGASEQRLVVTSVPDAKKGERLAVVHALDDTELAGLLGKLPGIDLPNLWIPRRDSFVRVEAIPVLGTGKVDLRAVREAARSALS